MRERGPGVAWRGVGITSPAVGVGVGVDFAAAVGARLGSGQTDKTGPPSLNRDRLGGGVGSLA